MPGYAALLYLGTQTGWRRGGGRSCVFSLRLQLHLQFEPASLLCERHTCEHNRRSMAPQTLLCFSGGQDGAASKLNSPQISQVAVGLSSPTLNSLTSLYLLGSPSLPLLADVGVRGPIDSPAFPARSLLMKQNVMNR